MRISRLLAAAAAIAVIVAPLPTAPAFAWGADGHHTRGGNDIHVTGAGVRLADALNRALDPAYPGPA